MKQGGLLFNLFIFFLAISAGFSQGIRIMPLGNSITQANSTHQSYRYPLWKKLIDDNLSFDYVGTMINNKYGNPVWPDYKGQVFDQNHEGHWGWRADQILYGHPSAPSELYLALWLETYTPEIALIHLGSNDIIQYQSVESTISDLQEVIITIRNANPDVVILLAQLIPTTLPVNAQITELNLQIPAIAETMSDPESPIYIVDQNTGFDPNADTYDGIHPNETGEEKMAQKWRDAILEAIKPVLNVNVLLEGPCTENVMKTCLTGYLPLSQPFGCEPWNYSGTEVLTEIPAGTVDWVLVELRDTTQVELAFESCMLSRKACLVDSLGHIRDVFGSVDLRFDTFITDSIFVVVYHRNHLPVISSTAVSKSAGKYFYDFTIGEQQAFGAAAAQKYMAGGYYAMISGDINQDGVINYADSGPLWALMSGLKGYLNADCNLDCQVDNKDKNDICLINLGYVKMVP
jgi:hypothetical protein